MYKSRIFRCSLVVAALLARVACAEVQADHAYVRAMPPGQTISAAFLQLRNNSDKTVSLQSAQTDSAESVEVHQNVPHAGVMHMRPAGPIEIPPQAFYRLEPGAAHLMLIGVKHPLKAGDSIRLSLNFSDGQQLNLDLPVHSPLEMGIHMDKGMNMPITGTDNPGAQQHPAH